MKKMLSLLGAIGLVATSSSAVVSCGNSTTTKDVEVEAAKATSVEDTYALILSELGLTSDENSTYQIAIYDTKDIADKAIDAFENMTADATIVESTSIDTAKTTYYYVESTVDNKAAAAAEKETDPEKMADAMKDAISIDYKGAISFK